MEVAILAEDKQKAHGLNIVGPRGVFPKVTLIDPPDSGYVLLGLEVDHRPPIGFFWQSARKKQALGLLHAAARQLDGRADVLEATVFKAQLTPPGRGAYLRQRPQITIARYDLVLLVELKDSRAAKDLRASDFWEALSQSITPLAHKTLAITASCPHRIGPVDHSRPGVFLFNFFYADDLAQNLAVWEYTAGWFMDQTGLDNSTLLLPDQGQDLPYTVINHCRWDSLWQIIPSLLFKKSFHTYVEDNFTANRTAPIPVLYRLA